MKDRFDGGSKDQILISLKKSLEQKKTIVLIGCCKVDYVGRAQSSLNYGDRIVLIKGDGSLIVHRPYGYQPVNWQPIGCTFDIKQAEEGYILRAVRDKPRESVDITFKDLYFFKGFSLKDEGEFSLYASELEMKEALTEKPDLLETGFKVITPEKSVPSGFVDIYGIDKHGRRVVVELKRRPADKSAALQLSKYIDSLGGGDSIRGIIAAPGLTKGVQKLVDVMGIEFRRVDPKECAELLAKRRQESRPLSDFI